MAALLDTNVLSELLRQRPAPAVSAWIARQPEAALYVSAVTQAELLLGVRLLPAGKRRSGLAASIDAMFEDEFAARVLPFDGAAAGAFADIVVMRRGAGRPIGQFDAQIAATAAVRGLAVATRDTADFSGCGITVVDPWRAD